jgi:hypothetical protein
VADFAGSLMTSQMVALRYVPNLTPNLGFGTVHSFGCSLDTGLSPVFPISKPFGSCFVTFFQIQEHQDPVQKPGLLQDFFNIKFVM